MHYTVLNAGKKTCEIEVVKSDTVEIKRKPNQIFTFKEVDNFIDAIVGHNSVVICIGKEPEGEDWRAFYWEVGFDKQKRTYYDSEDGTNIIPYGSLAILHMNTEFDVNWRLEYLAKEAKRYLDVAHKIRLLARKIDRVDDENPYADANKFKYMGSDELENTLEAMEEEYKRLVEPASREI